MKKIIVLQGPPACGKSTKAKELLNQYGADKAVIVCRDSIREACGEYWEPSREDYISDVELFSVKNALARDMIPIIDATNLNKKTIEKWKKLAEEYRVEIEWISVVVPYQEALKRDSNPDRKRPVGKKVIRDFYSRYFPHLIAPMSDNRYMLDWDASKRKAIIVDIDGTLALRNNRSPFDYDKACGDTADFRMCRIIKSLIESDENYEVFFLTGREDTGNCRRITEEWIGTQVYTKQGHNGFLPKDNWTLLMRPEGEERSDEIIKKEIWEAKIKPWYDVVAVFDDRDRVVKMWREEGLLCLQPYYGNF